MIFAAVDWRHYMFMIPLMLLSIFLTLVILVQRGRGGGLTGALGGMGGQSAFGTKAGDLFTRITIIVAAIWVLLSMASLKVLNQYSTTGGLSPGERGQATPVSKMGEGLLPSATKTGETPAEKAESSPATPTAEKSASPSPPPLGAPPAESTPATTPLPTAVPTAPSKTTPAKTTEDTGAKPADSAKP